MKASSDARATVDHALSRTGEILVSLVVALAGPYASCQGVVAQTNVNTTGVGQQSETAIAINPTNTNNIIIGANNNAPLIPLSTNAPATMVSTDGGITWNGVQPSVTTANRNNYAGGSDPAIAFDSTGNAYLAYLLFNSKSVGTSPPFPTKGALVVAKLPNGATSWNNPVTIVEHSSAKTQYFEDREAIAVDQSNNNVYISWTHFEHIPEQEMDIGSAIFFSRSTDGGTTFSPKITIARGAVQYSSVAVAPNGDVYVAWSDWISHTIDIAWSRDHGLHFRPPVVVGQFMRIAEPPYKISPQLHRGIVPYAIVACDPDGNVYVAWTDLADGAAPGSNDTDIFLRKSTDRGLTWNALGTSRKRVNGDAAGASQFNPAMAIDASDKSINISYYDTRADSTNAQTQYFLSRSTDGGQNFSDILVSTAQSNEASANSNGSNDYGDYSALAATGGAIFPAWTDRRTGLENIFTARVANCSNPAVLSVTNTSDTVPPSAGSLRFALGIATGCDRIVFQIPASGPTLAGQIATITDRGVFTIAASNITIDGTTEAAFLHAGSHGPPLVVIDGTIAKSGGIVVSPGASNTNIIDLSVVGSSTSAAIDVSGANTTISQCWIGVTPQGLGNANQLGIFLRSRGGQSHITGNIISGNFADGIQVLSNGNSIGGNLIGVTPGGNSALGNGGNGILLSGNQNLIGNDGSRGTGGNVISGNALSGISIIGRQNIVGANRIGAGVNGSTGVGNQLNGVEIVNGGSSNFIGTTKEGGGGANVISGNQHDGVAITGKSHDNEVNGNLIGLPLSRHGRLSNGENGVRLAGESQSNRIGARDPRLSNVISGNDVNGILIMEAQTSGNSISRNFIGTESDGATPAPNHKSGILIADAATGNRVGGGDSETNVIAFNGLDGVRLEGTHNHAPLRNSIRHNSIHGNRGLGINLVGGSEDAYGVTANDASNSGAGPNALQPYPKLSSLQIGSPLQIRLFARPNSVYWIELFENSRPDPSGFGQGGFFFKGFNLTTDASGHGLFTMSLDDLDIGGFITATATDNQGNTSEFSNAFEVIRRRDIPFP